MAWASRTYLKAAAFALGAAMLLAPSTALTSAGKFKYTCKNEEAAIVGTPVGIEPSVCYSPFHNKEYPLLDSMTLGDLQSAMDEDFSIMASYFSTVCTYYSAYYGIPVAPIAAKYGMKLYLGVYMTDESWYSGMVDATIQAVKDHPDTISAILVGNENIKPAGSYSAADVKNRINDLRGAIQTAMGRTDIPIGTVQRSTEWLDVSIQSEMLDLAKACDIVGVNIYPFFDKNFNTDSPALLLDGTWNAMMNLYPPAKLRVTETGWPTAGAPVDVAPLNTPSLANSQLYYDAFTQWQPASGGGEAFWFMFFDRAPYDTSMGAEIETYFGFYTWEKKLKMTSGYPDRLSESATIAPATTTAAPAVTTATPQRCGVRKD